MRAGGNSGEGGAVFVEVPPRFRVVTSAAPLVDPDSRTIALAPSGAFGDGRHETTRTCLQALATLGLGPSARVLDVGSGSGILAIGAAKLGASAIGVEIDATANGIARENARRSGVAHRVTFDIDWPPGHFDVVVANILRAVLVELATRITACVADAGSLVLSGLVSTDVPAIVAAYAPKLGEARPEIFERDVWRTLVWRRVRRHAAPPTS